MKLRKIARIRRVHANGVANTIRMRTYCAKIANEARMLEWENMHRKLAENRDYWIGLGGKMEQLYG